MNVEQHLKKIMTIEVLREYYIKVNEIISSVREIWNNMSDFCLDINLEFKVSIDLGMDTRTQNFKEYFKDFPDFEIEELSSFNNNHQLFISKKLFINNKV